ncbi:MAG: hypothetical protein EAZ25_12665 [Oscillatoriales cyanobacterium]|nr:MAG: hypothetical protein EAZ45_05260 [Oscillatoriales cyanobacterium]TAG42922.1 MAG: hypothetical protein EAZ33_14045 [Oscillatoriales cyanobacterium]TAG66271.1 MAG: hypothetical protein EAZ25_12665 [Oscillatoriales cyanobacterium]
MHLGLANTSVGAKHDRRKYGMITDNLYAVMLRPLQKPDAPQKTDTSGRRAVVENQKNETLIQSPRFICRVILCPVNYHNKNGL